MLSAKCFPTNKKPAGRLRVSGLESLCWTSLAPHARSHAVRVVMVAVMGRPHHEQLSYEKVRRDVNGSRAQFGDALDHFFRSRLGNQASTSASTER